MDCGLRKARFRTKRSTSPPNWDSSGLPRTKAYWGGRERSGSGAMRRGYPENGPDLYSPWKLQRGGKGDVSGFSAIITFPTWSGFVYSRMDAVAAAEDLHRRIRAIGDREPQGRTATVSIILDGENAWEYYPGMGANFCANFTAACRTIRKFARLRRARPSRPRRTRRPAGNFPGVVDQCEFRRLDRPPEDVRAWDLLRDAREAYERVRRSANRARRRPSRNWSGPTKPCSPPRAATGTGGMARSTVPRTTPSSTSCIASI